MLKSSFERTIVTLTTICLSFGCLSSASAKDRRLSTYRLELAALVGAGAADVGTTMMIAHANAKIGADVQTERNPLVSWMEPRIGTGKTLIVGAAVEVGLVAVACKLLCEDHPKLMKWGVLSWAGGHGIAAGGNVRTHIAAEAINRRNARP